MAMLSLTTGDLPIIILECKKHGLLCNQTAYVLATVIHETAGIAKPINEIWGPTAAQSRYDGRADLGNVVVGDGRRFAGRGYLQITGRRNYTDWAKRLGVDLVGNPALALVAGNAVRILVEGMKLGTFTGKKLADYIDPQHSDFVGARRIINGQDRAVLIAGYAAEYDVLLKADGYGEASAAPATQAAPPAPVPPAPVPPKPEAPTAAPVPPVPAPHGKTAAAAGIFAIISLTIGTYWSELVGWFHHLF